ncbi:hypothetical protein TBLA_0A00140 [Henningerozyma blattae CBS 6284]|uniref:GPI mannosyltransferase 2 n=1 Tax=Henningerozyma blattae (strain ATCC 34711 / CBS 6284 / DSM 70876 / NBRC 10599 / NRRL Y-10934 / UCD 77-7) TaxID=1071380 RepID=I2GUL4_HENB6|nr:hypothetical protein TBLA_0A00140 [Tetrapisispora blattae CBS 6284]CCH57816.1 hypothetical protein TBLA_0A00140 [Tetrapisispora blattae CBS 6284]
MKNTLLFLICCRIFQYALVIFSPSPGFDTSTTLFLEEAGLCRKISFWETHLWNKLLSWDSIYFLKTSLQPDANPQYEHEYAFSPLWASVIRYTSVLCGIELPADFKSDTNAHYLDTVYAVLKIAVSLNNLLILIGSILLWHLTDIYFSNTNYSKKYRLRLCRITVTIFSVSSMAGFMTSIYSESLALCFSFTGLIFHHRSLNISHTFKHNGVYSLLLYFWSMICFILATQVRSNCLLLGIYYLFDLLACIRNSNNIICFNIPLLSGLGLFVSWIYTQYYFPFCKFCLQNRGEWCLTTWNIPYLPFVTKISLYQYIQSIHWHVGFLKYWTINNIPNFIFALPNIVILISASVYFMKDRTFKRIPLIYINFSLCLILIFFANVQIINRVSSFLPLHLWYIAIILINQSILNDKKLKVKKEKKTISKDIIIKKTFLGNNIHYIIVNYYLIWLVIWFPLQTIFFASFLPPA